ncbi:hypothetical protein RF11_11038 [Thelohanellus kitauei]|uniref:Uncharacterized protein n=1 Tax=Thelohanellus kitauei TaxID=669202 RepID=A0A0C2MZ18_THEKT|nr:hypothetical protein RF11_11038 [Thelohanellus kitauei]
MAVWREVDRFNSIIMEEVENKINLALQKAARKLRTMNEKKMNFVNEKINADMVDKLIEKGDGEAISDNILREIQAYNDDPSSFDVTRSESLNNSTYNVEFAEVANRYNIAINSDTKKLIDVIIQQKKLQDFYALLSGLQITIKQSGVRQVDGQRHLVSDYECCFMPALIQQLTNGDNCPVASFILSHDESLSEIQYTPSCKSVQTENVLFKELLESCYFDTEKASCFLDMLLKPFCCQRI